MDTNDDFYGKELNLNCFYMHTNFEQKYPKTAIVIGPDSPCSNIKLLCIAHLFQYNFIKHKVVTDLIK